MKKFFTIIIFTMAVWAPAVWSLDLELTRGSIGAIPVAVVPFGGEQRQAATVTAVIQRDLRHSGWFRVLAEKALPQLPTSIDAIQWQQWQPLKLDAVLLGQVVPLSGGRYQISFSLINILTATAKQPTESAILLQHSFQTSAAGIRHVAHHISDLVYEKMTGDRGVFTTKIAYVLVDEREKQTRYELAVSDIDGHEEQIILRSKEPIMSPAWRPDGQALAYVSFEGGRARIMEQSLVTGKRRVLSATAGMNASPAYSPNGRQLALVRSTTGYPKLFTLNLLTHKTLQLTHGWSIDTEPRWAPDGRGLYFTSNRGGSVQIYYLDLASQHVRRISYHGRYNASARVTPNGQALVMLHKAGHFFDIVMQNLKTGQLTLLTQSRNGQSPTLAPNGKMVMYAAHYGQQGVLEMVATNGRISSRLPARMMDVQEPGWSPYLSMPDSVAKPPKKQIIKEHKHVKNQ